MRLLPFLKRRWFDFRQGHSIYLAFFLSFINFTLISYRLLIEKVPFLHSLIPQLWIFVFFFITVYIPTAMTIGRLHRKKCLRTDIMLTAKESPYLMEMLEKVRSIDKRLSVIEGRMREKS